MLDVQRLRACERFRVEFDKLQDELRLEKQEVINGEDAVALTNGEIATANNTLDRIVAQINAVAQSAVGCVFGDKRDCIVAAMRLANEQAAHEDEERRLGDKMRDQEFRLEAARERVLQRQGEIQRTVSLMESNQCSDFPLF